MEIASADEKDSTPGMEGDSNKNSPHFAGAEAENLYDILVEPAYEDLAVENSSRT